MAMAVQSESRTINQVFDQALNSIEEALKTMAEKSHFSTLCHFEQVAMQAYKCISSLQGALVERLMEKEDADEKIKSLMDKVESIVKSVKETEHSKITALANGIIKEALSDQEDPLISEIYPRFMVVQRAKENKTEIVFKGRFPKGERKDCALFRVGEQTYDPESSTKTELRFLVDTSSVKSDPRKFQYIKGQLELFYKPGWVKWSQFSYQTLHGIMSEFAGEVTATKQKTHSSGAISLNTTGVPLKLAGTSGWKLVPDSMNVRLVTPPLASNWVTVQPQQNNDTGVVYTANPASNHLSSDPTYQVSFKERRVCDTHVLRWGESLILQDEHAADEQIEYISFKTFDLQEDNFPPVSSKPHRHIQLVANLGKPLEVHMITGKAFNKLALDPKFYRPYEKPESKSDH